MAKNVHKLFVFRNEFKKNGHHNFILFFFVYLSCLADPATFLASNHYLFSSENSF